VLHVDDDPAFAELTAEFLEREADSLRVTTETGVPAALDSLADGAFDCIVSDYQMPGADGLKFLDRVRDEHPDLPFILFTGKGSEDVASEAIVRGVTDYLQKQAGSEQYELLANRCLNAVRQYRAEQRAADLDRVRGVVRDVNQALVRAEARAELERRVCEIVAGADPYQFAWIGAHEPDERRVAPRTSAGVERGYLSDLEVTTDDSETGRGPTGMAVKTGEIQVTQDVHEDPAFEPWREAAVERGYRSSAAVPLRYGDEVLGVLNVYADRPRAFDESERNLLTELGDDVSHALHALAIRDDLRRTTARLEVLFENSPDMIDVHDDDGRIVDANPRLCEQLGYSEEELLGKRVWEVDRTVDPDAAHAVWDEMSPGDRYEVAGRYQRRDGSSFPVEVHIQRLDVDGSDRFMVISRDVSERKADERKRERIIDRVTDAIVRVDEEWRFTFVDDRAEELYGVTESELLGEDLWEAFSGTIGTQFEAEFRRVMETREPTSVEAYYDEVDDWFHVQVYPNDDDGGLSLYTRKITERKERERTLERQNERLDEFASIVSHDLRNPLAVAEGNLELATESCDSEYIEAVGRAHDRMRSLIDDLLTLGRGDAVVDLDSVDLANAVEASWHSVETTGATLAVETDGVVRADGDRLRQLLENLFRNAVEHGSTGNRTSSESGDAAERGSTSSHAERDDAAERSSTNSRARTSENGHVRRSDAPAGQPDSRSDFGDGMTVTVGDLADGFYVEDDGPGIPEDERGAVFDRGYSTTDGTGLGLHIVGQIADAHGWDVSVTSGSEGGARFEVAGVDRE
jgi:PAS domain S-box-containing protein